MNGNNGTSLYSLRSPHFNKKPTMPSEQREKLLAMHKESRANAGIYVAVVLTVYVILLTILLCRYARRQRLWMYSDNGDENNHHAPGFLNFSSRRRLKTLLCCHDNPTTENSYPLTGLTTADTKVDQNIASV